MYLKRERLEEHWNGKFLAAQLCEAAKPGHYAHCYFFGRLVPHPTRSNRLVVKSTTWTTWSLRCEASNRTEARPAPSALLGDSFE